MDIESMLKINKALESLKNADIKKDESKLDVIEE